MVAMTATCLACPSKFAPAFLLKVSTRILSFSILGLAVKYTWLSWSARCAAGCTAACAAAPATTNAGGKGPGGIGCGLSPIFCEAGALARR